MLWTKITIHTVNVCGSGYFHIGVGNDIVDLFLIFKGICYNLALVGVTIEKGSHWLPKVTIAVDSRGAKPRGVAYHLISKRPYTVGTKIHISLLI